MRPFIIDIQINQYTSVSDCDQDSLIVRVSTWNTEVYV